MKTPSKSPFRAQIALLVFLSLALVWLTAFYELYRGRQSYMHEAEVRSTVQAQLFAEYSRSTIKRINEFILDTRTRWDGDWASFSRIVQQAQENIDDLTFQVAIIDKNGLLAFSNLSQPSDRTDLSQREHFRVHKESGNADRLFISRPVKGKVSGKWSIQVTRPILKDGKFDGVVVVSVSPEQFVSFAQKLRLGPNSVITVVRNTGEIMARFPDFNGSEGKTLVNRPFLGTNPPLSGNYRQIAYIDQVDRIFGFYTLPEYGMTFLLGEAVNDVLAPYDNDFIKILGGASVISLLASLLFYMLSRSLHAVEEGRRQLDEILSLSPDGFVSFDAERQVKYVSPTFLKMTGLKVGEIIGLTEDKFAEKLASLCLDPSRFPPIDALRQAQAKIADDAAGTPPMPRQLIELTSRPVNRMLEVGLRLSDTASVSQILYFRDVTHETEVDRMKSEFLSTAAHELRTPMASIYGYSELMLAQEFPADEQRELLGIIYSQSELMISIINELLDLVRIEERRGKDFNFIQLDAEQLLVDSLENFKPPALRSAPIHLPPRQQHVLRADRTKLIQVINNVLSNAYKYSPNGGLVEVSLIEDGAHEHPGFVGIRISDQGIGMTQEQLARIFERFYRADTSGKIPGTGLGMSIVHEIIQLHGGTITLRSQPGQGTEVNVWIPGEIFPAS